MLVSIVTAVGAPAAAHADSVTPHCESPPGVALPNCSGWQTADVRLSWDVEGFPMETSNCGIKTFDTDSPPTGFLESCLVTWDPSFSTLTTVAIRLDKTPPVITGALPARPPDQNGWWTHPIEFAFVASDPSSGVTACDTVTYSGPDAGRVPVSGSCRDVAGNSATATQLLNYDATPPTVGALTILRDGTAAVLGWTASSDVVTNDVVRSVAADGANPTNVYSGAATAFSDLLPSRDIAYRYTVTAFDQAGNSASTTAVSEPDAPPPLASSSLRPLDGARLSSPPLLRWRRVRRARYYNVQLFRDGRKILSAWPRRNRLRLDRSWRYGGKRRHLSRGWYRWYVWPGRGPRADRNYGKLVGSNRFFFRG